MRTLKRALICVWISIPRGTYEIVRAAVSDRFEQMCVCNEDKQIASSLARSGPSRPRFECPALRDQWSHCRSCRWPAATSSCFHPSSSSRRDVESRVWNQRDRGMDQMDSAHANPKHEVEKRPARTKSPFRKVPPLGLVRLHTLSPKGFFSGLVCVYVCVSTKGGGCGSGWSGESTGAPKIRMRPLVRATGLGNTLYTWKRGR